MRLVKLEIREYGYGNEVNTDSSRNQSHWRFRDVE